MYPIITIGRQYGSGGREIGKKVAELLGIPYYDKELLLLAANESGINYHVAGNYDEKPNGSFLYSIVSATAHKGGGMYDGNVLTLNDKLFIAQKKVIERLASGGPCVIVGRCADSILKDMPNHVSVFIHAPEEYRAMRVAKEYSISVDKAMEKLAKTDKDRAAFYKYNSGRKWGAVENYALCLNSSLLSTDDCARVIASYARSTKNCLSSTLSEDADD